MTAERAYEPGMVPARIAIHHMVPQPDQPGLEPYWLLHCVCGFETTAESPADAFDEAYQHYTSHPSHHSDESKMFIDYGPERYR